MDGISLTAPFDPTAGPLVGFYNPDSPTPQVVGSNGWENRIGLVEDYSELEYTRIDLTVGGTYNFSDRLYTSASVTYSDFDDDEDLEGDLLDDAEEEPAEAVKPADGRR